MRHCLESRAGDLRTSRGDGGFTLIEVLVAFLIIAIIATAGTSLTIRGMRVTMEAKQLTQAKNLVSAQVETMRGLPYFVSSDKPAADVLDQYFPNLATPAAPDCSADAVGWLAAKPQVDGYVTGTARCPFEPSSGPFYRTVVDPLLASGTVPTALVVSTQFVGLASGKGTPAPPVTPAGAYSSTDTTGRDIPPSSQVAAQVTAVWGTAGTAKVTTSRIDIADRRGGPALVSAETNAAAVVVQGTMASGEARRLELGSVSGEAGVTVVTEAAVQAVGGSMQTASGREDGAAQVASAPGAASGTASGNADSSPQAPAPRPDSLSIGATSAQHVAATNSASNPAYSGAASAAAGSFSLDQDRSELGLSDANPLVRVVNGSAASLGPCLLTHDYNAFGAEFMSTGTGSPSTLSACARAGAARVELFPIDIAPNGLIQVEATDIVATCEINGITPDATIGGELTVRWLTASPGTYDEVTIAPGDPDLEVLMASLRSKPLANGLTVGHYITSWGAFSGVEKQETYDAASKVRFTSAKIPAALSLATVAIRPGDPDGDSQVKVTIGRAIATATDRR